MLNKGKGGSFMLKEALDRAGYSQEEHYFHQENRRLIEEIKKDPLKIPRALRDLAKRSDGRSMKAGASASEDVPQKKVA